RLRPQAQHRASSWLPSALAPPLPKGNWVQSSARATTSTRAARRARGGRGPGRHLPTIAGPATEASTRSLNGPPQVLRRNPRRAYSGKSDRSQWPRWHLRALGPVVKAAHAAHRARPAVEAVGRLHRPLLVADDQELRLVAELVDEVDEPAEVDVVERRLDLVED